MVLENESEVFMEDFNLDEINLKDKSYEIGDTIRRLRIQKNKSVLELALSMGVSSTHIYKLESGKHGMSLELLFKLISSLGADANTILGVAPKDNLVDKELMKLDEKTRAQVVPLLLGIINQVQGQN